MTKMLVSAIFALGFPFGSRTKYTHVQQLVGIASTRSRWAGDHGNLVSRNADRYLHEIEDLPVGRGIPAGTQPALLQPATLRWQCRTPASAPGFV